MRVAFEGEEQKEGRYIVAVVKKAAKEESGVLREEYS